MVTEVKKIRAFREEERNGKSNELRQVEALELIADTLEAMRSEFVGFSTFVGRVLPTLKIPSKT